MMSAQRYRDPVRRLQLLPPLRTRANKPVDEHVAATQSTAPCTVTDRLLENAGDRDPSPYLTHVTVMFADLPPTSVGVYGDRLGCRRANPIPVTAGIALHDRWQNSNALDTNAVPEHEKEHRRVEMGGARTVDEISRRKGLGR